MKYASVDLNLEDEIKRQGRTILERGKKKKIPSKFKLNIVNRGGKMKQKISEASWYTQLLSIIQATEIRKYLEGEISGRSKLN